ncbi:tRNA selenocysteine 1-associated protein 1-like [Xyrauchen texanus]|uniref:tRNA selenocysteine 1-associated protein 1-like n=1 Tax=Xyrauchen texanus TaxID=154827 RepID=UPI00224234AD|nr:tRNA selenocysteine 1-associated protein 1-like [Xyrauchen texanus]
MESPFTLFVMDLITDVDDGMLYEFFHYHFSSCCSGNIVLHSSGYSKSCGFVSFESERDQIRALADLQGASGLGKKPLGLSLAKIKLLQIHGMGVTCSVTCQSRFDNMRRWIEDAKCQALAFAPDTNNNLDGHFPLWLFGCFFQRLFVM